jgi:hypothetical protein
VLLLHDVQLPCGQQLHGVLLLHDASAGNHQHSSLTLFAWMMRLQQQQLLLQLPRVSIDAVMAARMQ